MITINETLYKKMPDDIKACFKQLPNPSSEEVRECFPETNTHGGGKGSDNKADWGLKSKVIGEYKNDSGNASRFFKSIIYQAKASKSERNKGCEGLEEKESTKFDGGDFQRGGGNNAKEQTHKNNHPTVKPIALMEYLIKMVTPKGGIVLDPFAGSGTTGVACKNLNRNYILIEKDPEYCKIAEERIKEKSNLFN